jgi:hypothetical protein
MRWPEAKDWMRRDLGDPPGPGEAKVVVMLHVDTTKNISAVPSQVRIGRGEKIRWVSPSDRKFTVISNDGVFGGTPGTNFEINSGEAGPNFRAGNATVVAGATDGAHHYHVRMFDLNDNKLGEDLSSPTIFIE